MVAAAARVLHDEVFLHLEQPTQAHLLRDEVDALGHHAHLGPLELPKDETSPLVVRAGPHRVYVADDLDLAALEAKLERDERAVAAADDATPTNRLFHDELQSLVLLSIPITGSAVLEMVPPMLVVMLLGQVSGRDSPHVLAAGTLADFVAAQTYMNLLAGLSAVVSTLCAQAFGANEFRRLWLYAQAGLVACVYGLAPVVVVCSNGEALLRLLGQDPALARTASTFIWIGLLSVPFVTIYTVASSALQAQNIATPFIIASALGYAVSLPLAYVAGYYTSLGYVGVLLCVAVGNIVKVIAVVPVLLKNPVFVDAWPGWQWREAHALARTLTPLLLGSVAMATCLALGMSMTGLLCGLLPNPTQVMSASSIATLLLTLAYIPMVGLSTAGTVRVGNALGAGQPHRASVASTALFVATVVVSLGGVGFCWAVAAPYARANTSDDDTVRITMRLSTYLLPFIPLSSIVLALQSVFQACGAMWFGATLNFVFLVVVAVPLGLIFALKCHGGVYGLWNGQLVGSVGFILAASAWLRRLDWHAVAHEARRNAHIHVDAHAPKPCDMDQAPMRDGEVASTA